MAVLVSGASGFIGSHTCVELLNVGEDVIGFDNFYNSKDDIPKKIEKLTGKSLKFYKADMCVKADIHKIFTENEIDSVIHFAGYKAVGESVAKPLMYYGNNIDGTVVLLEAMKEFGCDRFVFSSSATVYKFPAVSPAIKEDFELTATNHPYGTTKMIIENICRDVSISDDKFACALLRYFNPVGAHDSGVIGENPNGIPNNLMPIVLKAVTGQLPSMTVFGNDYPTPDGTCIRDYLHVVDLAKAHVAALNKVREEGFSGCAEYNLGTGKGTSVLELLTAFEKVNGLKIPYIIGKRRPGDAAEYYAVPEKAEQELGWRAELNIEDMCKSAYDFAVKNA
ncbi:MAG: UDP-glucose 4-epimerase GalE [Oscillospiraceae bacterium]|jgi:UDP-glucose 4-epimerase|nr:UDP-glucose 4-epimerase GalE [Oscillospiraceae bacterium]